jgi:hypothetical protein
MPYLHTCNIKWILYWLVIAIYHMKLEFWIPQMLLSRNSKHFYLGKFLVILFKFLQRVTYSISLILLTLLFHWKFLSSSHVFYIIFFWFHIFIFLKILTLHNFCMCFSIWYYFNSCIIFLLCIFKSFKDVKRLV